MTNPVWNLLRWAKRIVKDSYRYTRFRCPDSRGVFDSLEAARASTPRGGAIGYDNDALARQYRANLETSLHAYDYPVLFHLDRILRDFGGRCSVLDFGGNVGVHYLRFQKYLNLTNVKWIVCDVPAIVRIGRETCAGVSNVSFIDDLADIKGAHLDIVLASSSMQYVESSDALLRQFTGDTRPRHILVDQMPMYDGPRFATLQNGGLVYYPQFIFNKTDFIDDLTKLGYKLADFWDCDQTCTIPFHSERSISSYGMCFFDPR